MPDRSDLGKFEGKPVIRSAIAVKGAGDGLSAALKVDPAKYREGETVFVALECRVQGVTFEAADAKSVDGDELVRKHNLKTVNVAIIDGDLVGTAIDATRERIAKAKAAEAGQQSLGDDADAAWEDPERTAPSDGTSE